jgi:hypothetical protein
MERSGVTMTPKFLLSQQFWNQSEQPGKSDCNRDGVEIDRARQPSTAAYQSAMMMLGATLLGMIAALLIRETGAGGGAAKHT